MNSDDVFTLGHSNHSISRFVELLKRHNVTAVGDVRSRPFSRMNPQFNKDALSRSLKDSGIAYSFLGKELGARPDDPACYVHGRARYELIARTVLFQHGLDRVMRGSTRFRIALVCAEKDPMTCHRAMLVCRHLVHRGVHAKHILATGEIEEHADGLRRVAAETGVSLTDLFRDPQEILEDVYARRAKEIEYVELRSEEDRA
ncbi:DUF488 domain-containing protein [Sorangium sp. So ce269]